MLGAINGDGKDAIFLQRCNIFTFLQLCAINTKCKNGGVAIFTFLQFVKMSAFVKMKKTDESVFTSHFYKLVDDFGRLFVKM